MQIQMLLRDSKTLKSLRKYPKIQRRGGISSDGINQSLSSSKRAAFGQRRDCLRSARYGHVKKEPQFYTPSWPPDLRPLYSLSPELMFFCLDCRGISTFSCSSCTGNGIARCQIVSGKRQPTDKDDDTCTSPRKVIDM